MGLTSHDPTLHPATLRYSGTTDGGTYPTRKLIKERKDKKENMWLKVEESLIGPLYVNALCSPMFRNSMGTDPTANVASERAKRAGPV